MAAPPEIRGFNYDMMWHQRLDEDPAHRWFREQVSSLGQQMMNVPPRCRVIERLSRAESRGSFSS